MCSYYLILLKGDEYYMDEQKINCTVESCKFNDGNNNKCILKQITVTPVDDVETELPDESMCSSYENYNM